MTLLKDEYKPTLDFARKTMQAFARAGVDDISQRATNLPCGSFVEALVNAVGGKTKEGDYTFAFSEENMRRGKTGFWPLPHLSGKDKLFSFFRPKIDGNGDNSTLIIHLLLLDGSGQDKIGFRFEKAPVTEVSDRHHYSHAQLLPSVTTLESGEVSLFSPFFQSCPGIPVPAIGQFGSWFAAVTAVAGHQINDKNGIVRAFNNAREKYIGKDFEDAEKALRKVVSRMLFDQ